VILYDGVILLQSYKLFAHIARLIHEQNHIFDVCWCLAFGFSCDWLHSQGMILTRGLLRRSKAIVLKLWSRTSYAHTLKPTLLQNCPGKTTLVNIQYRQRKSTGAVQPCKSLLSTCTAKPMLLQSDIHAVIVFCHVTVYIVPDAVADSCLIHLSTGATTALHPAHTDSMGDSPAWKSRPKQGVIH